MGQSYPEPSDAESRTTELFWECECPVTLPPQSRIHPSSDAYCYRCRTHKEDTVRPQADVLDVLQLPAEVLQQRLNRQSVEVMINQAQEVMPELEHVVFARNIERKLGFWHTSLNNTWPMYLNISWNRNSNRIASPWQEIGFGDYMWQRLHDGYGLGGVGYDQVKLPMPGTLVDEDGNYEHDGWLWPIHYEQYYDRVLAIAQIYVSNRDRDTILPPPATFMAQPGHPESGYHLRFFRIGCQHPNKVHTSPIMFEQRYVCPDCGWSIVQDSSG